MHNRQLGLKLFANVTYGYTSAGYSGRMPSCEIGDSIVCLARETLQRAIKMVESSEKWNAKVVYSDTDSMFILVENRSPEEAIAIGKEIAREVTNANPEPIKLQFEKIYCPMIFFSKKHYAGYKYEDVNQLKNNEKVLESKGIETVRRDSCEAVCKIMQKCLKILFEKKDLSDLKSYLYRTFDKIITGRAIVKDFVFAKEVKLGCYKGNNLPPSAQIAFEKHVKDPNFLPKVKEREPYIVIMNQNNSRKLKDCVISPDNFFSSKNVVMNHVYYIEKQILPVVARILAPINVDVYDWYSKYPRPTKSSGNLYAQKYFVEDVNLVHKNTEGKSLQEFFTRTSLALKSDNSNGNGRSEKIDSFFNKSSCNMSSQNKSNHMRYRQLVENIQEKNLVDERLTLVASYRQEHVNSVKRNSYEQICRVCSGFDKLNVNREVPCRMYLCKIFYEKFTL